MSWTVEALCGGRTARLGGRYASAIAKQPLPGLVEIGAVALAGDEQADLDHHGGPDMALHHYPLDHHAFWRGPLGDHDALREPGAFGSNIATHGLTEEAVNLGARFMLGTALIEACQPRQPCATIERRFGHKGMVAAILETGRCGWFYRVIETGAAKAGDRLEQVGSGDPEWTMARMFAVLWGQVALPDRDSRLELAAHPLLPEKLRRKLDQINSRA